MSKREGFTLIELLIVVAIIGILAAIAIPNFLQAQVRAKISRVQADLRNIVSGTEIYFVDNNAYPTCDTLLTIDPISEPNRVFLQQGLQFGSPPQIHIRGYWFTDLTTPIDYMSSLPKDPFPTTAWLEGWEGEGGPFPVQQPNAVRNYFYWLFPDGRTVYPGLTPVHGDIYWIMGSPGPDQIMGVGMEWRAPVDMNSKVTYDPTNGTISGGNIFRMSGD